MFIKSQEIFNLLSTDGNGEIDLFEQFKEDELNTPELKEVKSLLNKKFNNKFVTYGYSLHSHNFDIKKLFVKNQYEVISDFYKKYPILFEFDPFSSINPFSYALFMATCIIEEFKSNLYEEDELNTITRDTGDGTEDFIFCDKFVLYSGVITDNDLMIFPCDENNNVIRPTELISIDLLSILDTLKSSNFVFSDEQISEIKVLDRKLELEAI